ncbi:hypothetical protein DFH06DRAFT_1006877, partial [Mycena polygramma]
GRAVALRLASDGFDVAVNDIPSKSAQLEAVKAEVIAAGRGSAVFIGDVSVDADVKALVAGVVATFGGLDVAMRPRVGCIEVVHPFTFKTAEPEDWDRTFAINVRGTFLCYKHAAKQMVLQGRGGRIIGACSGAGKQAQPGLPDYSASKFAVRGLTQAAALDFGKHGITVNAYAPL